MGLDQARLIYSWVLISVMNSTHSTIKNSKREESGFSRFYVKGTFVGGLFYGRMVKT